MSELINKNDNRTTIRWKLLTGASALALAYTSLLGTSRAEDADRPSVWLELGGQLSQLQDGQETFAPPLTAGRPAIFAPSQKFENPPRFSIDEYGKLSFQPESSDWSFSASTQYGRSSSYKHEEQQTNPVATYKYPLSSRPIKLTDVPVAHKFAETSARNSEKHVVLDFQAGKDLGLGLFANQAGSSRVNIGVRIAQFKSASNFALKSDPDWNFEQKYVSFYGYHLHLINQPFHTNRASLIAERSFRGIGPSVSWESSLPLGGNVQDGEIVADFGIDAALLFGRQKAKTHHQSTGRYGLVSVFRQTAVPHTTAQFPATPDHTRSRNVTVPNIGGSVGLSWRLQNFKMSLGYKADFFFGAIDGGIDTRKSENRGFFGPFASVSVGLGD
jgi:iron complex outermembrane recepter protein